MYNTNFNFQEDEDSDSGKFQLTEVASSQGGQFFTQAHQDMSTFFRDNRRKIDFVMVYEENVSGGSAQSRRISVMTPPPAHLLDKKLLKQENWRQRFMANLRKAGLDMEEVSGGLRHFFPYILLLAQWSFCYFKERFLSRCSVFSAREEFTLNQ